MHLHWNRSPKHAVAFPGPMLGYSGVKHFDGNIANEAELKKKKNKHSYATTFQA